MDKNKKRNLEAVTRIDGEILDKQTKKRIALQSADKKKWTRKRKFITFGSIAAALVLIASTVLVLVNLLGKQVPVYTGMTVSKAPASVNTALYSETVVSPTFADPGTNNGLHKGHYKGDCKQDTTISPNEEPFETPLENTLTVIGPDEERYYAKPNEDIYITVHIDNPDSFEILSFTLNGEKYTSYMFEHGSDLENLILKVNVGDAEGVLAYTIDAIKYVDGEAIKDVEMGGDQTVEIGVYTENQPVATVSNEVIDFNSISFGVAATDEMALISGSAGKLEAVIYDGEEIVARKEISLTEENAVRFDGLATNKVYQYAVLATYDSLDGTGMNTYVLLKKAFRTKAVVLFDGIALSTTSIEFAMAWDNDSSVKALTALELFKGESKVCDVDVAALKIDALRPNTAYVLVASYQNGNITEQIRLEFTTDPLVYTVNYLLETLDGTSHEIAESVSAVVEQDAVFAPVPKAFEGFAAPAAVQKTASAADADRTVNYYYQRNSYTLTMNNSGVTSTAELKYGASLTAVNKPDFDFLGWFNADGQKVETMPTTALSVFATWKGEAVAADLFFTVTETDRKITIIGLQNEELTELVIPAYLNGMSVVAIGTQAFKDQAQLTKVIVPDTVLAIGSGAFSGCAALKEITIPFVGGRVKESTDTYQYPFGYIFGEDQYQGGVKATQKYYGSSTSSTTTTSYYIPSTLTTVTVTGGNILRGAFYHCTTLTAIHLPETLTEIAAQAFALCSSLPTVVLPEGITTIGQNAFSECAAFATITLPSTLKKLSTRAFMGCAIETINLPSGLESIEEGAFFRCSKLETVTIEPGNTKFRMDSGCLIDVDNKTLLRATVNATIPTASDVKAIGDGAFSAADWVTALTVPANIETISRYAFYNCSKLQTLQFTEGGILKEIGMGAFERCSLLSTVAVPNTVISMGEGAFASCKALTSVSLPFIGAKRVAETNTYQYPFAYIFGTLDEDATAPAGFTRVCQNFFGSSLTSAVYKFYAIPAGLTHVTVTDGTYLPAYAFHNCSFLQSVTLPSTLQSIGKHALRNCSKLETVTFPTGVTSIGQDALYGCTALESVTLPFVGGKLSPETNEIKYPFGYIFGAFSNTKNQAVKQYYPSSSSTSTTSSTYYIPKSLKSVTVTGGNILQGAFYGCSMLESITLPQNITSIATNAFYGCTGLGSITLPQNVTTLGTNAFYGCTGLSEFALTEKMTSFNASALTACTNLATVSVPSGNTAYSAKDGILFNKAQTSVVYAPLGITGTVTLPQGVLSIGQKAFYQCTALESISLPDSLTTIGQNAFQDCTALTEITIPTGLTAIGGGSFIGCTKLSKIYYNATSCPDLTTGSPFRNCGTQTDGVTVYVGANVKKIPNRMFADFSNDDYVICIKSVVFTADSVCSAIGSQTFRNCTMLESITLPVSLTAIEQSAFTDCSALTTVYYHGTTAQWTTNGMSKKLPAAVTVYYYSATEPAGEGNHWHDNDGDGIPNIWSQ